MAPGGRRAGNLPTELTSFAGRREKLAEVRRLLAGSHLVTLTGKWLTDFDFDANPAVNAAVINTLASLDEAGDGKKGAATVGIQRQRGLRCRAVLL
jgi:hypothetical protein